MLPGELVAIADIAHEILGQDGWAARRVHILEMRKTRQAGVEEIYH